MKRYVCGIQFLGAGSDRRLRAGLVRVRLLPVIVAPAATIVVFPENCTVLIPPPFGTVVFAPELIIVIADPDDGTGADNVNADGDEAATDGPVVADDAVSVSVVVVGNGIP